MTFLELFDDPKCVSGANTAAAFSTADYEDVVAKVLALYDTHVQAITHDKNNQAAFAGCLVRAAGHDFMDYREHADGSITGGSDACMNFKDPDNMGVP